jgi:hypothetical protein
MATANTTSTKTTGPKATSGRKPARGKAAGTRASTRTSARKSATGRARTQSRSTRAKSARTRVLHEGEQAIRDTSRAARQAQVAGRDTAQVVGDYAERAVLIPVGAALIARDRVVSSVTDTLSIYSSSTKTQQQLRRFERRGATARNRLEREVRKARVRVERQLRQRRRVIERTVGELEDRRDVVAKNGSEFANELATRIQESVLNRV